MAGAVVIGSGYCNARATDILVQRPVLPTSGYKFTVTDISGNFIFGVKGTSTTFHKQRALVDSNGKTIVTFRMKWMSMHKRWQAFRGNSIDTKDLLFSARESSMMDDAEDVDLDVYLGDTDHVAYKVSSSFEFYNAHSRLIIAEPNEHKVKVFPNVDMAFVASLIVILDGMSAQEADGHTPIAVLFSVSGFGFLN